MHRWISIKHFPITPKGGKAVLLDAPSKEATSGFFLRILPAKRRVQLIGYIILPVADEIFSHLHAEIRVGLAAEGILRL